MSNELADYLRFYKDLGFRDISAVAPTLSAPAAADSVDHPVDNSLDHGSAPAVVSPSSDPVTLPPDQPEVAASDMNPLQVLQSIQADIGDCTRCRLHEGRNKLVFGVGNPEARLVFVGEGPGADEDAQGIPFVGRAGQLLTQMIERTAEGEGIPIKRPDIYICNVVKCRPPGNRAPEPDEMEICGQFLQRQIKAINPRAICVLGSTAAKALLNTKTGITKLRGEWQEWGGIQVMPTFHPSYLLRAYNKEAKRLAWEDLKKVLHYVYD